MNASSRRQFLILAAFVIILLVFGLLVARKFLVSPPAAPPAESTTEPKELRDVVLYFGSPVGSYLEPEGRQIEGCLDEQECLRETVQALVDGPVGDLVAVLPSHTQVRGVTVAEGIATIDFSAEVVTGHPGGSVSELLTVYSLADTIAENFPHIRQVRIVVEGEPVETLKGHVDLREPVQADFSFTRPPEGAPSESTASGAAAEMPATRPGRETQ